MNKAIRIILHVLTILIALLLIAFGGLWYYVKHHKQEFLSFIESETGKSMNGASLHVGDIGVGFKSTFPLFALTIDSVYLRDSLWYQHHHDLVSVNRVYATIDFWQLFRGKISIRRLELDKPEIYVYTDSLGYSNASLFNKSNRPEKTQAGSHVYPILKISDGSVSVDDGVKHKFYGFHLNQMDCDIGEKAGSPVLTVDLNLDCIVQGMEFNRKNGAFLENTSVRGDFRVLFDKDSTELDFNDINLVVDQQPFVFTGKFFFAKAGTPFILSWDTKNLSFRKGVSFLSTNLKKTLEPYDISDFIEHLTGSLDNSEPQYRTPLIHLWLNVEDKNIKSPFVAINHASFTATYNNEAVKFRGHEDSNTIIRFSPLRGNCEELDFHSDSIVLNNLIHPRIKANVISDFDLSVANRFLNNNELVFTQGSGKINLAYSGSLEKSHDSSRLINGRVTLNGAGIRNVHRNILFTQVSSLIRFTGRDMIVESLKLHTGSSDLNMNGKVESIFYLFNHLNDKLSLNWDIESNKLDFEDFTAFLLKKPKAAVTKVKKSAPENSVSAFASKLVSADFKISLKAKKLTYKKLSVDSLQATLVLNENAVQLKDVSMRRVVVPVDEGTTHKYFGFRIDQLDCNIQEKMGNPVLTVDLNLDCIIEAMTFNRKNGAFLENKSLRGDFRFLFNKDSKELDFANINLLVEQQPFVFTGKFFFAKAGTPFLLSWDTKNLSFRKGVSFLSPNLRKTLGPYDISDFIEHLTGSLDNSEPRYSTPLIHLWLNVEDKNITSPFVAINNASFTATFNNEAVKFRGHEDSNTVIRFSQFRGSWEKLNFHSDSVVLSNLIHPRIKLNVISDFDLAMAKSFLNESELSFTQGSGKINLAYTGSLEKNFDSSRLLTGTIELTGAGIHYLPRNLLFSPVSGMIRFTGKDMLVENLALHSGSSDLNMNGSVKNIFYLFNHVDDKLFLDWNISSNRLNLEDFAGFLRQKTKRVVITEVKKSSPAISVSEFTGKLTSSDFNVSLKVNKLSYKKFSGDSLFATLVMKDNLIQLNNVIMKQDGGSLILQGLYTNDTVNNSFSLATRMSHIDVSRLFYSFDNFGLESLTDKNIRGSLSADITMEGGLTPQAQLVPDKLISSIKFNLQNGALVNFKPMQQIQEKILKKRNLSDIRFADLYDSLEVRGGNITINRMEIRSSVLSMFVNGMYNLKTGPDMSIQVPLSNLKANKDSVLVNKGIHSHTGISARLRVRTGADGKLDVSWDPFNKATKEMNEKTQLQ
ncbi:MAG TPA: AsmA-like C-terminal region-containing protein [Puia sp.]